VWQAPVQWYRGIATQRFDAEIATLDPGRLHESVKFPIIGMNSWIRTSRNVYIQETVNFMRAFGRGHAC
jgi:hypothetical protein